MTRQIPRMEKGAADSMSIAATLVYILDISGEIMSRMSVRIRQRRKQIMEVTMTFRPTLSETHIAVKYVGLPSSKDVLGKALSTTAMIASTAGGGKARGPHNELLYKLKDTNYVRHTRGGQVYQSWNSDDTPSRTPNYEASVHLSD